jgi:hypothetical protein
MQGEKLKKSLKQRRRRTERERRDGNGRGTSYCGRGWTGLKTLQEGARRVCTGYTVRRGGETVAERNWSWDPGGGIRR